MSFVKEFFTLNGEAQHRLYQMQPEFGYHPFGEIIFYRTYSHQKSDGRQESWADCILRVVNGVMSIRKDWYLRNFIAWDEVYWQKFAADMSYHMFKMYFLPPGRSLWAMGRNFVFERGSMALNNCGSVFLKEQDTLANKYDWMMDALMLGVGVGFRVEEVGLKINKPIGTYIFQVPDSREGWTNSIKLLLNSYLKPNTRKPIFDYSLVRKKGELIKGFGGKASGPEPLMVLHKQIEDGLTDSKITEVELKINIANQIGVCVVAGNVRRSAELAMSTGEIFLNLKDYKINPHRAQYGWMSNNSIILEKDVDFEQLGEIANRVIHNGEPGIVNVRNFKKGRIGHKKDKNQRKDHANSLNPCGEITLEDYELCNLVKTFPTKCPSQLIWYRTLKYATFYASTCSLLPTHRKETNKVVSRNRRIGVDFSDYSNWIANAGLNKVIKYLRAGYKVVKQAAREFAAGAGVPEPIKCTTVAPGGTVPKLVGKVSGIGYPTFNFTLRRFRIASNNNICPILDAARIPYEKCIHDPDGTRVYEFPIHQHGTPAKEVTLWEQAINLIIVQREWADNAVSNTLYFKTTEIKDIEKVLSSTAPLIKSCSLLPHSDEGAYPQMPEEGITEEEYHRRLSVIQKIDWSKFRHSSGEDEKYCISDTCTIG